MKINRLMAIVLMAAAAVYGGVQIVLACRGTPRPSCQQVSWLSKIAPAVVVSPPGPPADIIVPIGLIPWLKWTENPACAEPVALELELAMTCTPVGGGAAIDLGVRMVPLNTAPFPQCIQGVLLPGGGPAPLNIYAFVIPAGTLPPGDYICLVTGEFNATFAGGNGTIANTGAGILTAVGDVEVCISEPAEFGPPDEPRLDCELLVPDARAELYQVCRRGDQTCNYYQLTNYDTNYSVAIRINTATTQIAGLPSQSSPTTSAAFAYSGPVGTDAFPQVFSERKGSALIPEADPSAQTDNAIEKTIILPPQGVAIVGVDIRSFGACADGSCCDVRFKAFGTYENGDEVVACASTAYVVDSVPGKSPLCEYYVQLKTGSDYVTAVTPVVFDGDPHHSVFKAGNVPPYGPNFDQSRANNGLRMQVIGTNRQTPESFAQPPFQEEYVRLDHPARMVEFGVATFDNQGNRTDNFVTVTGLEGRSGQFDVPFFMEPDRPQTQLRVDIDLERQSLRVSRKQGRKFKTIHTGQFSGFGSPPLGSRLFTQPGGCVSIFCDGFPTGGVAYLDPPAVAELIDENSGVDLSVRYTLKDRLGLTNGFGFSASADHGTITPTGSAGDPIDWVVPFSQIATVPDTTVGWVDVSATGALNSPVYAPYALRRGPLMVEANTTAFTVTKIKLSGRFGMRPKDEKKSKVTLKATIPVPEGFDPENKIAYVQIGNWGFFVPLSNKGKGKEVSEVDRVKTILKIATKKKRGTVPAQEAKLTFKTKGGPLCSGLYEAGLMNEDVPKPGRVTTIPVKVFLCGELYCTTVEALLKAKQDKGWSFSGPPKTR